MSKRRSPASGADGLEVHLAEFLTTLARAGYAETTQHDKRRLLVPFIGWARGAQLAVADLDEACVGAFLARPSPRRRRPRDMQRATLQQFLEHLRAGGVVPQRRATEPSAAEVLVRRYREHLRSATGPHVRG